ncbi:TPM domain-containing protein [Parasediminibacterium sp. JCM 36343]|uniref:TPM domain-containing protein n=1 Tax=Parasediminibacterium sp. JCM 36343 TaxID=3374279 RepID=UPI00397DB1DE
MFNWFKRKAADFFSPEENDLIVAAIKEAEHRTSGEIRVYIESKCTSPEPLQRAIELFDDLGIYKTKERNGVLVYIAIKSRQLAIYGDESIYKKVGKEFWDKKVAKIIQFFDAKEYSEGIATIVKEIGEALHEHFPYNNEGDINELPDDIVFGK